MSFTQATTSAMSSPSWRRSIGRTASACWLPDPSPQSSSSEIAFVSQTRGLFLGANPDGVVCVNGLALEAERLTMIPLRQPVAGSGGDHASCALMTSASTLITCSAAAGVRACDTEVTTEAMWDVVPTADGRVLLRGGSGHYMTVRGDGLVYAGSDAADESAQWWAVPKLVIGCALRHHALEQLGGAKVALWFQGASGRPSAWVTAEKPAVMGGGAMFCRTRVLVGWETFTLLVIDRATSRVALRSDHARFLSASPGGVLQANREAVGGWEQFELLDEDGTGRVALRTCHNTYVSTREERMDSMATTAGACERFLLLSAEVAQRHYALSSPDAPPAKLDGGAGSIAGAVQPAGPAPPATSAIAATAQAAADRVSSVLAGLFKK